MGPQLQKAAIVIFTRNLPPAIFRTSPEAIKMKSAVQKMIVLVALGVLFIQMCHAAAVETGEVDMETAADNQRLEGAEASGAERSKRGVYRGGRCRYRDCTASG